MTDDPDRDVEKRKANDAEFAQAWDAAGSELAVQKAVIAARLAAGLSQRQLADRIGTSQSAIARMEAGTYHPRVETLLRLADALHNTFEIDGTGVRVRPAA
ncbi:MAG TPA: helix-turn-helix transcriptional regulator [Chloroflexota bacterium]|nr:helix-turn-helix transcriptional regulator [Chloroflexota bacterium]